MTSVVEVWAAMNVAVLRACALVCNVLLMDNESTVVCTRSRCPLSLTKAVILRGSCASSSVLGLVMSLPVSSRMSTAISQGTIWSLLSVASCVHVVHIHHTIHPLYLLALTVDVCQSHIGRGWLHPTTAEKLIVQIVCRGHARFIKTQQERALVGGGTFKKIMLVA